MLNNARASFAKGLVAVPVEKRRDFFRALRKHDWLRDGSLFNPLVGGGNASRRRQGEDTRPEPCGCVVCEVYGGDCGTVLYREAIAEEHRARRGVKTKGSRK